ncbi:alkaline phosphatase D family protein [Halochromatium glycolicum]|uniref:Alkaline phosphatase D n=1 Tax=Halochromatium glycolicum TaxID=85075 RepID=A0AAJ0U180_9GAMM|nr:alkaline phosphatase D family protein [Halochromatium glycolicum]MBK1703393.1 hypothetical protein [Halochromatium glycolicum]
MSKRFSPRRRALLRGIGALGAATAASPLRAVPRLERYPFTLGVASGYPGPGSLVLWTRLAPEPLAPHGGLPERPIPVRWELAHDPGFRRLAASGTTYAEPQWAHSVHLEPYGLEPDREYWYRFQVADATSPIGRTRTAPTREAEVSRLRIGVGSCQHYAQGWFSAYRYVAADALDLFLHVGDYIYESSWGDELVRSQGAQEPVTLNDYRRHYALYKADPDLQAAHASCPWLVVWDDHEVENDYAGPISENNDEPAWFLKRRAAAYQAYYEHMPLPRTMVPFGPNLRLHTRLHYGQLADLHLLDNRQYRSPQPCPRPGRAGSAVIRDCPSRHDPKATMLGARQEQWLAANLRASEARWNLLGQQTLMAQADGEPGPGQAFFSDGWDGYPAARRRLLDVLAERQPRNPVVLGGDVHSFWVTNLKQDFDEPESPTVASEFVTTSITSQSRPEERIQAVKRENPHILYANGTERGYLRLEVTPERVQADLLGLSSVKVKNPSCHRQAAFIVEAGQPGPQNA